MKRLSSTDFDVITGPSMASACPIVETAAEPPPPSADIAPAASGPADRRQGRALSPASATT
jgi:hypothetical protein